MPPNRHRRRNPDSPADEERTFLIRSVGLTLPPGFRIEEHAHSWGQLIYASSGVMTVRTRHGSWVVPSRRAVWVPMGTPHEIEMSGTVTMRTLYFRDGLVTRTPNDCHVLHVSPLLRELILRVVRIGILRESTSTDARLAGVILDELRETTQAPLDLRHPADPRARFVAEQVVIDPGNTAPLEQLRHGSGASTRTLERLFLAETEMTFGRWRQQVRMLHALRLLASGTAVTAAALDVGYDSTSAFIAAFKRNFGATPGRYYSENDADEAPI